MSKIKNGYVRVLLFLLPYFFVTVAFQFIAFALLDLDPLHSFENVMEQMSTFQHFFVSFFGLIGALFIIYLFRVKLDKKTFFSLGFSLKKTKKDILVGLSLGLLPMLFSFLLFLHLDLIVIEELNFIGLDILYVGLLFISVSLSEEILIRGYVLSNFMDSSNKYIALLISSLLFSLMHGFNPKINAIGMVNLFLAGVMLGITYLYTKNLWFAFSNHFSWNFFQAMFGFHVSGLTIYSPIKLKIESSIWTGGEFGIEGSVLTIFLQLTIIVFLYFKYKDTSSYTINASN